MPSWLSTSRWQTLVSLSHFDQQIQQAAQPGYIQHAPRCGSAYLEEAGFDENPFYMLLSQCIAMPSSEDVIEAEVQRHVAAAAPQTMTG
mmetsp:Transcript_12249/g.13833  ORF Transcript_12249/g.13833 Transcript_12249/m.13833 type:complete len:89 (+) Transcript_12249:94-360(+)